MKPLLSLAAVLIALPVAAQTGPVAPTFDVKAALRRIDATANADYPHLDRVYKDIHAHPELGYQETRTSALLAAEMRQLGFTVTEHVGKTGIVALYRNGDGPTVLVRTELDALPMEEKTGLPYASQVQTTLAQPSGITLVPDQRGNRMPRAVISGATTFVAHSCGHDAHMAWWLGTARALLAMKDRWHGTLMFVGQPAEEGGGGAKAMLADGLFKRFAKPSIAFAAHVGPFPLGVVLVKEGAVTSAADAVEVVFNGRGAHGSTPSASLDPIVMGAHFVSDVQTVVSREKDPGTFGVLTVGTFNAGTAGNIIPSNATLKLTLRSYDDATRKLLLDGVERTARATAAMARAPAPTITLGYGVNAVRNDLPLTDRAAGVMTAAFGPAALFVPAMGAGTSASEDFSEFVDAGVPSVYFMVGGTDPKMIAAYKAQGKPVPVNHSPDFAPVPEPTIKRGIETLSLAVLMVMGTEATGK